MNMNEIIQTQSPGAVMVMLPQSALEELKAGINELKTMLQGKAVEEVESTWIESAEARQLLGISQRRWQTMRDRREIPFSQFGRKIYVRRSDLEAFMQGHLITSNRGGHE